MFTRCVLPGLLLLALGAGCAPMHQTPSPIPPVTPTVEEMPDPMSNPGSLYSPNQAETLFADNRARRVGDILMVTITDATTADQKADTKAQRESTTNFGVTSFATGTFLGAIPLVSQAGLQANKGATPVFQTSSTNDHDAKGETKRSSTLTTSLGVRIVRLMPGGVMQVEGARQLRLNDENQILVVRGLVRQRDVGPNNSVDSMKLADSRIELYGEGILADKQRPGWLSRILDHIWPF